MPKQQNLIPKEEIDEMTLIGSDLTAEEVFILGFLKGFNRTNSQQWSERDLGIFRNPYYLI
jgi:hypothetical protein